AAPRVAIGASLPNVLAFSRIAPSFTLAAIFRFAQQSPFIAGLPIIAVGVVVLLVAVVQDQRHLRSVQRELDQAKEQVIRSKATADDLEKSAPKLKKKLDETNKARTQLQGNLDKANSTIEQLRKEQLKENQTHAQELMTELEKARKQADEQLTAEKEANQ